MGDPSPTMAAPRDLLAPRGVAAGCGTRCTHGTGRGCGAFFGPDSIYYDVPTTAAAAARGPEHIEAG
ncbi:hypothetical protein [Pseudofrankia sp. DC12]|uniref:hypothetical protein n=1 Tax=Pseudofrankia sp. DC12 TaxID=683315 RepID=UPI0005F85FD5|nr:hypothetical protein [Pseudofrankia sp. DC12]